MKYLEFSDEAKAIHQKHLSTCKYCIDPSLRDDSPEYQKHAWHENECHICLIHARDTFYNID